MNETELVNLIIDTQITYNLKLFILFFFTVYALFIFWYWNKTEVKYLAQFYTKRITLIFAKVWFVALPLWTFFLYRAVAIDVLFRPMIILYGIIGLGWMIYMFTFGAERIKEFFTGERFYRGEK